jgi:uncharacterized membrane protein YbaN (DUF454 family)
MTTRANPMSSLTAKAIAIVLIVVCVAIGAVGLVLPIIPGLLFLGLAAIFAAKLSPSIEHALRRNKTMSGYIDSADGFGKLGTAKKIEFACWLCLKMLIDGVAFAVSLVSKAFAFASVKYRYR